MPVDRLTQKIIPWIVAIALFMETLDATILTTAIPRIAESLGIDPLQLKFALTSYLLSLAVFIPISGWCADRWGVRRVFVTALAVFTLSSVWCGLSRSLTELVLARILQGLGGAFMMPVGRLIIVRTFSKAEFVRAMNFVTMPGLIGPVMGPVVGGFITTYYSWPWIFYINVPVGIAGIILAYRYLEERKMPDLPRLDVLGFLLFGLSLSALFLGLESVGWASISKLGITALLLGSCLGFVCFYWRHKRGAHSIVNFQLFSIRTFSIAVLGNLWVRLGPSSMSFLAPLFFQVGYGVSPWESGLLVSAWPIGMISSKLINQMLLRRWGFRKMLSGMSVSIGVTMALFATLDQIRIAWIVPLVFVNGVVMSLQYTGMNALYYVDVSQKDSSYATSIASILQQLSPGLGIALSAVILQSFLGWGHPLESGETSAFRWTFLVMGVLIVSSVCVFRRLKPTDGQEVL